VFDGKELTTKGNWMKRTAGILSLVSIALLLGASGCSTLHKSDSAILQGTWKGQEVGITSQGECSIVISGNTLKYHGVNPNEWYKGTFTLREDVSPKQIVYSVIDCPAPQYNGKTGYALYRIEAGSLTIAGNEPGSPQPPASFDAPDSRRFVLKKKQGPYGN
jgi:uncharacterized protein (TIGR03067 family)